MRKEVKRRMARKRRKKRKNGVFAKIIVFAFVIYSVATLISLQIKKNDMNDTASILQVQVDEGKSKLAQTQDVLDDELDEDYVVSEAQKQGYAAPNERVFVDVSGQ